MQYTEEQQRVISHAKGHARVIAVAGSGKTQTLTAYVLSRLAAGVPSRRLLVLMYNKAAQLDFTQRLQSLNNANSSLPDVRTFHSLGYRICQRLVAQGDMPPFQPELLSDAELEPVIWRLLRSHADPSLVDDILSRKKKWVEPMMGYMELVKSNLQAPDLVFEQTGLPTSCGFFVEVFHQFEAWRMQSRRLTFGDLLYEPAKRFNADPKLASQFSGHMDEILVDEYQDINPTQQFLLETLHGNRGHLVVVGDPDQTIYEFRGSEPSLLTTQFQQRFAAVTDFQLSHTFRFGHRISVLANQVIAKNYAHQEARTLCFSHSSTSDTSVTLETGEDSADIALQTIKRARSKRPLANIAVLNRLWSNSVRLELLLLAEDIPYRIDNATMVLERQELRPFRLLLQLAAGRANEWPMKTRKAAWHTLLTQPFLKIKKTVIDQLITRLSEHSGDWGSALRRNIPESLSKFQALQLAERARVVDKALHGRSSAYELAVAWVNATDYYEALRDNAFSVAQVDDQIATVKAFIRFLRQNRWSAAEATDQLATLLARKTDANVDAVLITSIHKAKGRQWPLVIIPELNGRFYPYQSENEMTRPASIASERRLLYVAMTRAQDELVLIVPPDGSETPQSPLLPSDFVTGIEPLMRAIASHQTEVTLPDGMHQASVQAYIAKSSATDINVVWNKNKANAGLIGQRVEHPSLGSGLITQENERELCIYFDQERKERRFKRDAVLALLSF